MKTYLYSTNVQVVLDADSRLVIATGEPQPGNRNDCTSTATPASTARRQVAR